MEIRVDSQQPEIDHYVRSAISMSETSPEEAAQNIDRAKLFDINPDSYKGLKNDLDGEALAVERVPAQVQPVTQEYVRQSEQHASLFKEDLEKMNSLEKRIKYYDQQIIELPRLSRDINELTNKKITEGSLDAGEEEQLKDLNLAVQDISKNSEGIPGISDTEKLGVQVLSATGDFIRSYWDNKEVLAVGVGGGAATGALAGSFVLGLGTTTGAIVGASKGLVGASTVIGFIDAYTQTRGSVYNELSQSVNEKTGEPLNIPHDKMAKVSQGVGIISGLAGGLAGKVLSSSNPFLKRFASPKIAAKLLTGSAASMAKMEILGGIVHSVFAEGGEEGLQQLVSIVGKEFAKMDDSEESFNNALSKVTSKESLKEIGNSVLVGSLTGGLISSVTSAPGYKGLKERYDQTQFVAKKRAEVLEAQNNMVELGKQVKDTKVQQYAPQEMNSFTKKVFSTLGVDENVWFTLDSLREFSNTPEKGEAVRKVIDPKGELTKMAKALSTPLSMHKGDLLQIVTDFPDITDHMRLTPDGESPLEVKNNARNFVDKLTSAASQREELLSSLGADHTMTPEIQTQLDELSKLAEDPNPYSGKFEYLDSHSFTEMPGILSKEEAQVFNTAHLDARLAVADSLKEDVDNNFANIENRIFKDVNEKDIKNDIVRLDKEFKVIDNFKDRTVNATTVEHENKGFSHFAIDPKSLPEDLKEIFNTPGPRRDLLEKRKVFVKGGLDLEESAALNGVDSGAELLRILAQTPSRTEITKNRDQRKIQLKNRINQTLKNTKLIEREKAFTNLTKIHIREMEHMRTKEWPTTKRGIIKIASPVPTVESLNSKARMTVSKLQVKELNANRFKQGESVAQRSALKNFLNGEFEQAFVNKEKAALTNEMRKETLKAKDKVAKSEAFWKKVNTPAIQQSLKDAGMLEAMQEFTYLYRLDGSTKNQTEQNSFNTFIKKQVELGNYTPIVPDRLDNTQVSSKELTVEQYQEITEMGQYIVQQSKLKNKLSESVEKRAEFRTAETIALEIEENTSKNVNYNLDKAEKESERYLSITEKFHNGLKTSLSAVSSIKTIISELDEYELNGYFHQLLGAPIKEARTNKRLEMSNIESNDRAIIEKIYGMDNFKKMFTNYLEIPEFKNIPTIGDGEGTIKKIDLLVMQAYMGDPEGREAMQNFMGRDGRRLTVEEVTTVLNRELDSKDAAFVQNFMVDRWKQFEERSFDLHKKTTGVEPDMIKGVSVIHNDKVLPGGYYPIKRQMLSDEVRATKFFESLYESGTNLNGESESHFFAKMRSAETTQQGRLKDRTGSDRPLDINFENIFDFTEEIIHDLHFREVGIDSLKILKNPLNVKNIKAVVGPKKFANLLNSTKDIVSKTTERESTLFGDEYRWVNGIIQSAHSLHAVKTIGLNLTSAAIQVDSLSHLALRVGPKSLVYLGNSARKVMSNLSHYDDYVKIAADINPDIQLEKDGIDNAVIKQSYDFIPASSSFFKKYKNTSGTAITRLKEIQRRAIDASFSLVRETDRYNKVITTLALSEQFLNGDVNGYPIEKLQKMSDSEKANTMRQVVQQAIDLSLTASAPEDKTPLEKNKVANIFTRYWTDRRSRLNSTLAQIDKVKGNIKRGENAKAATNTVVLGLALGASTALINTIRGNKDSVIEKLKGVKDEESAEDFATSMLWDFATSPIDQILSTIPLVDAVKYQTELESKTDYRNVSTPLFGVASDVAVGIIAMREVLQMAVKHKSAKLSKTQRKALLSDFGYIIGGAPTNGMNKAMEALQSKEVKKGSKFVAEEIKSLNSQIDSFINAFKDDKEAEQFIDDLKEYKQTLPQFDADLKNIIPENASKDIKQVLSNGEWNKRDSVTGAAGVYQFTEKRWNEIATLNPDLGLTENGRVSKDSSQQEKAMNWTIQDNSRGLMTYDIPVDTKNLLGAHKFGFDNYLAVYSAKDSEKLSKVLGNEASEPVFNNFKTVKDVKDYLNAEVKKVTSDH